MVDGIIPDTNSIPTVDGGAAALPYICYGEHDPSVIPTNGMPGIIYIRITKQRNGQFGAVGLYQKTSTAGKDTNWQMFTAGGGNSYTPSNPADWDLPLPTTYSEGLDQLAERVRILENSIGGALENIVYVAKNGNDATGDGSIEKPYLTVKAAQDSIVDASPTKRYAIYVMPGRYDEVGLTIKANIFIIGTSYYLTRIANDAALAPDASFTPAGDHRSGYVNINVGSALNLDMVAVSSNEGKFYLQNCQVSAGITFNAFSSINQSLINECEIFGGIVQNGWNLFLRGIRFFSGNHTVNSKAGVNTYATYQGTMFYQNINVTAAPGQSAYLALQSTQVYGTVTLDGAGVSSDITVDSPTGDVVVLNGASYGKISLAQNLAYNPALVGNWPVVPQEVKSALDQLAQETNLFNPKEVFVDIAVGSDATGTGARLRPFQTIPAALAYIAGAGPGAYVLRLAPGSYSGAPIAWPNNVSMYGSRGVSVDHDISYTSVAAATEFVAFVGIGFNGALSFDLNAANQAIVLFESCGNLDLSRLDSAGGGRFLQIFNSSIRALDIVGNVGIFNSLFTGGGPYVVQPLGNLILSTCIEALPITVDGNLQLNACTIPAGASTFTGSGTIFSDASSLGQGAIVSGPTVTLLDQAERVGYTPANNADWASPPHPAPVNAKEGLDKLASRQVIVEEHVVTILEASLKAFPLANVPFNVNNISVSFLGVEQVDTVDFSVSGSTLNWNGLGMDAIGVAAGDVIVVTYQKL